ACCCVILRCVSTVTSTIHRSAVRPKGPRPGSRAPSETPAGHGARPDVTGTTFPRVDRSIVADDGDEFTFCSTCAFSHACLSQGLDKASLKDLHMLVELIGPLHAGELVNLDGVPCEASSTI